MVHTWAKYDTHPPRGFWDFVLTRCSYGRTDGRTTRKHNASGALRVGGIKITHLYDNNLVWVIVDMLVARSLGMIHIVIRAHVYVRIEQLFTFDKKGTTWFLLRRLFAALCIIPRAVNPEVLKSNLLDSAVDPSNRQVIFPTAQSLEKDLTAVGPLVDCFTTNRQPVFMICWYCTSSTHTFVL